MLFAMLKDLTPCCDEGFFLVVCDPQWCGDDGIRKTFYHRNISDWKEDFRKITGYDWVFTGYEGDDDEKLE